MMTSDVGQRLTPLFESFNKAAYGVKGRIETHFTILTENKRSGKVLPYAK